jgi:hypothetical protein
MARMTAPKIAAFAVTVVGEDLGDAINVTGARIARDQALDELAADERTGVGMVNKRIERQRADRPRRLAWREL